MRKLVYILLFATAGVLASCSKNDVVGEIKGDAISFGSPFVGNSTKVGNVSYDKDNLREFFVYGNVQLNNKATTIAKLYETTPVTLSNNVWGCNVIQYWLPGCTYNFAAITDVDAKDSQGNSLVTVNSQNGIPTSITYDVNAQKDLLYAEIKEVETDDIGAPDNKIASTAVDGVTSHSVAFTFSHLLSKVHFTFTNAFANDSGVELTVTDIKINTTAGKSATHDLTNWGNVTGDATIDFGSIGTADLATTDKKMVAVGVTPGNSSLSSAHCYLIPGTYAPVSETDNGTALVISFTINHNKGGNPTPKEIVMPSVTLQQGYSYNFTAELNSGNVEGVVPIKFKITVKGDAQNGGWSDGSENPIQY